MKMKNFLRNLLWQKEWMPLLFVMFLGLLWGIYDAEAQDVFEAHTPCENCFGHFEDLPRV